MSRIFITCAPDGPGWVAAKKSRIASSPSVLVSPAWTLHTTKS